MWHHLFRSPRRFGVFALTAAVVAASLTAPALSAGASPPGASVAQTPFLALAGTPSAAGAVVSVTPARVADSRTHLQINGAVPASGTATVQITGQGGVPAGNVAAVVLNVTVVSPQTAGYITVWPSGIARTNTSNLNFQARQNIPNTVIVPVGTGGKIQLFNGSAGTADLLIDVTGYTLAGTGVPGSVTASTVTAATTKGLTLQWTNPADPGVTGVMIRRAVGAIAPVSPTAGVLVADVPAPQSGFTDTGLTAGTTYSYALFAHDAAGHHAPGSTVTGATNRPLAISTTGLNEATAGLRYTEALTATGGTEPYTWTATGLPAGLTLTPEGVISGSPTGTGTGTLTVTVTDTESTTRTTGLTLTVPTGVPAECMGQACAVLTPNGQTVPVPADHILSVTRNPTTVGPLTELVLTAGTAHTGDALVLAPTPDLPSGAIVVVTTVTTNPDTNQTVTVQAAGPADAYADGTVQAVDTPTPAAARPNLTGPTPPARAATPDTNLSPQAATAPAAAASLSCSGGVTSELHGLSVVPSLTPAVAALWKHPFFGGGGIYVGTGGLDLFQFDLDGTITLNVGVTVSGASTCTLKGPQIIKAIPAGNLGAVILELQPSLTLKVTGKVDLRASATLRCGAEYRWSQGHESRVSYCNSGTQPLQLSSDTGVDATLTAAIDASVTLDDIIGITGTLSATLHAGYHPTQHPVGVLDAAAGYELGACLACLWKGSPTRVTLVTGTFFKKTLGTWDNPPPKPGEPTGPPVITTTTLRTGTVGTAYTTRLDTIDHRPGTWSITSGAAPPGLTLTGDTLTGTPTSAGITHFTLTFADTTGRSATAAATITINPKNAGGTVWAWGYGEQGQLGVGNTWNSLVPVQVSGLTGVTAVAGGQNNGYALRGDGTVWAWGYGGVGGLGNGETADSLVPVQVPGLTGVSAIAADGQGTGYALRGDGTVWAWGAGWLGALGNGGTADSLVPVQVSGLSGVTAVAGGLYNGYAMRGDGTVWAWGGYGEGLQNAGIPNSLVPVQVSELSGVTAIAGGWGTGYATRSDGTAWAWGFGGYGALGNGGTADSLVPVQVSGLTGVTAISGGAYNGYAVLSDGTAWAWGHGGGGELGNGGTTDSWVPVQVSGLTGVTAITGGDGGGYVLRADGTVWAWGYGGYGALGNGGTADSLVPVQVSGLTSVTAIAISGISGGWVTGYAVRP